MCESVYINNSLTLSCNCFQACIIFQGPHIASVTLAAWTCMSVDFPEPPYPNEYVTVLASAKGTYVCIVYSALMGLLLDR